MKKLKLYLLSITVILFGMVGIAGLAYAFDDICTPGGTPLCEKPKLLPGTVPGEIPNPEDPAVRRTGDRERSQMFLELRIGGEGGVPGTCADGLDNDGDFLIDLADPECPFEIITLTGPAGGALLLLKSRDFHRLDSMAILLHLAIINSIRFSEVGSMKSTRKSFP